VYFGYVCVVFSLLGFWCLVGEGEDSFKGTFSQLVNLAENTFVHFLLQIINYSSSLGCDDFQYGVNCHMTCGHCKDDAMCDPKDGSCPGPCVPGFTGELCNTRMSI